MNMICDGCNAVLRENATFCPLCGMKQSRAETFCPRIDREKDYSCFLAPEEEELVIESSSLQKTPGAPEDTALLTEGNGIVDAPKSEEMEDDTFFEREEAPTRGIPFEDTAILRDNDDSEEFLEETALLGDDAGFYAGHPNYGAYEVLSGEEEDIFCFYGKEAPTQDNIPPETVAGHVRPVVEENMISCPKCGHRAMHANRRNCFFCGVEFSSDPWYCAACGKENLYDTESCLYCGDPG